MLFFLFSHRVFELSCLFFVLIVYATKDTESLEAMRFIFLLFPFVCVRVSMHIYFSYRSRLETQNRFAVMMRSVKIFEC